MTEHARQAPAPRSGTQWTILGAGLEARIASVGASLRSLTCDGVDLVVPFDADELRPDMRGALLAPWPNRTADGRYAFGGGIHRLPLNEPERGTAAHGLAAWLDFGLAEQEADRVALTATIPPQPGYPWRLRLDVSFRVGAEGLSQEVVATNESPDAAPVGLGGHPVLVAGSPARGAIEDWTLEIPAEEVLLVDDVRLLPVGSVEVAAHAGGALDFREGRAISGTELNNAFTRLARGADGLARVRLTHSDRGVEIAFDARTPWVQAYTTDHAAGDDHRSAVAIEPMTCPPDALNSARDLAILEPGESVSAGWIIRGTGRPAHGG